MTEARPADLAARAVAALADAGLTLSCAEADTGGGIGAALIDVAGVSRVFRGGVIAYANGPKRDLLGVPDATLRAHGSVSEETTLAMAEGARRVFATDVAIAQSGVTGPGGGTPERPVGRSGSPAPDRASGACWSATSGPTTARATSRRRSPARWR